MNDGSNFAKSFLIKKPNFFIRLSFTLMSEKVFFSIILNNFSFIQNEYVHRFKEVNTNKKVPLASTVKLGYNELGC
jgi:hypothetical protein